MSFWINKSLDEMTDDEWEQICDNCGQCCLNKIIDDATDKILFTNVACDYLDIKTARCMHYENRFEYDPDCIQLTRENLQTIEWLPQTCSYRYFALYGKLPKWHPLLIGNKRLMESKRISVKNRVVYEKDVIYWGDHVINQDYFR